MTRREPGTLLALLVALAAVLGVGLPTAHAALERVGPAVVGTGGHGYPAWYQDTTGLTLEFCTPLNPAELNDGWCLLLPGDTAAPEVFPTPFSEEHFYWAADAGIDFTANGVAGRARLVLALEGAFAQGPVVAGDQIVFGRIRIRINDLPYSGTYTVYTPYGVYTFENQVAGDRLFHTEDIGLNCPAGRFDCALGSNVGPFLLPSPAPGGPEMPPLTAANPTPDTNPAHFGGAFTPTAYPGTGKSYIADPARIGPVTGSPLPPFTSAVDGVTRDPNIFRIEGPNGFVVQTTDFALMGRLMTAPIPAKVTVDRASYGRSAASGNTLDVFATAFPTMQGRLPGGPKPPEAVPALSYYPAACGQDPVTGAPVAPAGVARASMAHAGRYYWGEVNPAALPPSVCVEDANSATSFFFDVAVRDEVTITGASYEAANGGRLTVQARSSDEVGRPGLTVVGFGPLDPATGRITVAPLAAPPARIMVVSDATGVGEATVSITVNPVNDSPVATGDSFSSTTRTVSAAAPGVLANDTDTDSPTLTATVVTGPANGALTLNPDGSFSYTANAGYAGTTDSFTYRASDGAAQSNTATVSLTFAALPPPPPPPPAPVASNDAYTVLEDASLAAASVLANDTGTGLAAVLVTGPANAASFAFNTDGTFTFVGAPNFNGSTSFTYRAQNAGGLSNVATATVTVTTVNDAPSFTAGRNQTVTQPAGAQTVVDWATNISAGPADEAAVQTVSFLVSNDNAALFSVQPAVASNGTLTYTPAAGASGSAAVTVQAQDSGGTASGGVNTSAPQTFTITVNASTADLIFQDGFESGTLGAWSAAVGGAEVTTSASAAMGGSTRGLTIDITPWDLGPRYVQDTTPVAEPRYRARFYFHPNGISMFADQLYAIMAARNATADVARIEFRSNGLEYQIRASARSNAGTYVSTAWYSVTDAAHAIEFDWKAATSATATDGSLTLWIDGVLRETVAAIATGTLSVDEARLGPVNGVPAGTAGTQYFDGFVSRRTTLIGP